MDKAFTVLAENIPKQDLWNVISQIIDKELIQNTTEGDFLIKATVANGSYIVSLASTGDVEQEEEDTYQEGYNAGYSIGKDEGYDIGYEDNQD